MANTTVETPKTETKAGVVSGSEFLKNQEEAKKKSQEKLDVIHKKWSDRKKVEGSMSEEDQKLFKKLSAARKLYNEINSEVSGVDLGDVDIEEYQKLRAMAFSEYQSAFNELVGWVHNEFN